VDDGGRRIERPKRNQTSPPDDLLWSISEFPTQLPAFHVDN
jgi:hypothetical protein